MHGWQQYAQGNKEYQELVDLYLGPDRAFKQGRGELYPQNHYVSSTTEGNFEEYRIEICVPGQKHIVDLPVATDINENRDTGKGIAKHTGEKCRPHQWVIFSIVEDIYQECHGIAAAGKSRADNNVVGDPDAPGKAIIHVGDSANAEDKSLRQEIYAYQGYYEEKKERTRKNFPSYRFCLAHILYLQSFYIEVSVFIFLTSVDEIEQSGKDNDRCNHAFIEGMLDILRSRSI
jgi:hypothetical protein